MNRSCFPFAVCAGVSLGLGVGASACASENGGPGSWSAPSSSSSGAHGGPGQAEGGAGAALRVTAYYAAWRQASLPPASVDFGAVSELIVASARPNADGTLDTARDQLTQAVTTAAVQAAHAAGRPVIVAIGGNGSQAGFEGAISDVNRDRFVQSIASLVVAGGYDGVNLDMEPLGPADDASYAQLVHALRAHLGPGMLLTVAANSEPAAFAALQAEIDEINLLSYDLSGPYPGWETWFDSPVYTAGHVFKSNGRPLPSCDAMVQAFVQAGVAPSKLNLGVHFYGAVWSGADGPNQSIAGVAMQEVSYAQIADQYLPTAAYSWQADVEAPYLSVHGAVPGANEFISFDDVTLVRKKMDYVRARGLGGVSIWELTGGHRTSQPPGQQDELLDALKSAAQAP